jgi:hypothetical protein
MQPVFLEHLHLDSSHLLDKVEGSLQALEDSDYVLWEFENNERLKRIHWPEMHVSTSIGVAGIKGMTTHGSILPCGMSHHC